jgi:NitT/TauT family transport system ATP-binding protein
MSDGIAQRSIALPFGRAGDVSLRVEPRLSVKSLSKSFRSTVVRWGTRRTVSETPVLSDINFSVAPGEVVTLLGPSGCGKTTLLRILAGLSSADRGEVRLDGAPTAGPSREKAFVFQHFGLLPWRNVLENVSFPLELDGVGKAERDAAAERYVKLVGLAGFELHYPHRLSGGMQQRVGIARALTRNPRLLLMDEPFGALDAQTREILQEELLRILEATMNTVVCVTHSISEAVLLSNKVLVFTSLPGRIKRVIEITRREGLQGRSRTSAASKEIERELRELLREENGRG